MKRILSLLVIVIFVMMLPCMGYCMFEEITPSYGTEVINEQNIINDGQVKSVVDAANSVKQAIDGTNPAAAASVAKQAFDDYGNAKTQDSYYTDTPSQKTDRALENVYKADGKNSFFDPDKTTSTILNVVRRYCTPLCILLFIVGAFMHYVYGAKRYDYSSMGRRMMYGSIIFLIIANVMPLVFLLIRGV